MKIVLVILSVFLVNNGEFDARNISFLFYKMPGKIDWNSKSLEKDFTSDGILEGGNWAKELN